jgi:small nuclear ribonucleoprotein (snRNP)-like protein
LSIEDIDQNEIRKIKVLANERKLVNLNDGDGNLYDRVYIQKKNDHKIRGHILAVDQEENWLALKNGGVFSILK